MNENEINRDSENNERRARDILFDNLKKNTATQGNEILTDIVNRLFDWLRDEGVPRLYKFFSENATLYLKALLYKGEASLKGTRIINEYEESQRLLNLANDIEKQYEIIDVITKQLSEDSLLYEIIDLFTRPIDCPHCHYKVTENWYDYILSESSSEKNMGTETIYSIECDEFQCPECNEIFKVDGFICAYPDGIYDSHRLSASTE